MSERFQAEALLRAAASGAIPEPGDTLVRTERGWVFAAPTGVIPPGSIGPAQITSLPFTKLTGVIADGQVPESAVTQHEAALSIGFAQLTGQIADGQVPASAVQQHLTEVLDWIDFLLARAVAKRPLSVAEKLYMAENYS